MSWYLGGIMTLRFDKHAAAILNAAGYECTHNEEWWEDDGDAENGPHLNGCLAYDEWTNGKHYFIVVCGEVVEEGPTCPGFDDMPF